MKSHSFAGLAALIILAAPGAASSQTESCASHSAIEIPDLSVIANIQADLTDPEDPDRHQKVRVKEIEIGLTGYISPSLRGDVTFALEQEYVDGDVETEVDLEEAYLSFLDLPGRIQADVGRKFIPFGRLNPVHPHHWAFPETPLALANLFGDHSWFDDGALVSYLVPNAADLHIKVSAGAWNGRAVGHPHGDEEEHAGEHDHAEEDHEEEKHLGDEHGDEPVHDHGERVEWDGTVFTGRIFVDLPAPDELPVQLGYTAVADEGSRNLLQALDFVVQHRQPGGDRRTKWHTELYLADDKERDTSPLGWFSYVAYAPDEYWEFTGKYDFTELLENDEHDVWAASGYLTRYLTHTTYLRAGYQYKDYSEPDRDEEHLASVQVVWWIGPHSHRLPD